MSSNRSHSRVGSYDEVSRYKIVTTSDDNGRARSRSRNRTTETDERYDLTTTRSRSKSSYVAPASTLRKRLIVCFDGTFCAADQGKENNPTNIARLTRAIANVGRDERGLPIMQVVSYVSGVGTGKLSMLTKAAQGGMGQGLNEKVCEGYSFIVNNYGPGDEIFIFGFSRGAYAARSLASFICQIGLLSPGMMDYFNEIFGAYKHRDRRAGERGFRDMEWARHYVRPGELGFETGSRERLTRYEWVCRWSHQHPKVKVVGVYDTVGSIGMPGWMPQPGEDADWHATRLHPKIEYAFHALALDEHRGNFPPTMFYLDQACRDAGVKLRQCWFPGYHSCVGGESSSKYDVNSVDEITFAWMIDHLTTYNLLQINAKALEYPILNRLSMKLPPNGHDPVPPQTPQEAHERRIDWSDGRLVESQTLFYHIASEIATHRWDYVRKPGQYHAFDDKTKQELETADFKETVHPTVWHRIQTRNYEPKCMPLNQWKRHRVSDSNGSGYEWVKASKSGYIQVRIPEYKIPYLPRVDSSMAHWSGSLEARIAPPDYLRKLDDANGIVRGRPRLVTSGSGSSRDEGYDRNYLSPTISRTDSGYSGGVKYGSDYVERETLTIRSTSPRPSSRGEASDYFDSFAGAR
nr:hypothetical protein B0A51_00332 [Rachicladosporium sp. CCFEE 5018]